MDPRNGKRVCIKRDPAKLLGKTVTPVNATVMSLNSTTIVPTRSVARVIVLDARDFVLMVRYREYRGNRSRWFGLRLGGVKERAKRII